MSPSIALHDPIFRTYLIIVPAVLVFGGLVLALIKKDIGPVWKTYRSWWVMSALAFVFVFAGRVPAIIGVMLLSILAMREFARASALDRERWTMCVLYVGIVAVALASFVRQDRFFIATLVFTIAAILLIPILRNRARGELPRMSLGIIGFLCLGWLFGHLGLLHRFRDRIERCRRVYFRKNFRPASVAQRNQPEQNLGRRARRIRGRAGVALAAGIFLPVFWCDGVNSHRTDRRRGRTTRRSFH